MTEQQAKDFNKWLSGELDAYMEDNNIAKLTDVSLERAIEEAEWSKSVALQWRNDWDIDEDMKKRYQGANKFLKKYGKGA